MSRFWIFSVIILSAIITFLLRALPFFIFRNEKKMPETLISLGSILPSAIMAVLIVYCLKDVFTDFQEYGVAELISVLVVGISYKWRHNTLLSIALGTVCNIVLLHMI